MRCLCAASLGGQERAQVISQRRIEADTAARCAIHAARARRRRRGAEGRQSGTLHLCDGVCLLYLLTYLLLQRSLLALVVYSYCHTFTRTAPIPFAKTANGGDSPQPTEPARPAGPLCFRWDVEPPPAACLCMSSLQRRVGWSRRSMAARKPGGGVALSLVPPSTCPCFAHSRPSVHASSIPWWECLITQCAAPSSPQGVNSPSTGTPSGVRYMSTR